MAKLMSKDNAWVMGRTAMLSSLFIAHVWGSIVVWAACFVKDSSVLADMLSSIGFMIFSILAILVGGKGWKDFASMKYGGATVAPDSEDEDGQTTK